MNSKHPDTDRHSNDLTQLSSREQLSALMDGALPADQTRFLLRRLQHDDSLAASWERWRIAGEAMRGLAPTQRLPADFARRVSAVLHGEDSHQSLSPVPASRTPGWLRWGGGAAMAASLAMVALLAVRPVDAPDDATETPLVAASAPQSPIAPPQAPVPSRATRVDAPAALVAATAAAAAPRPSMRQRTAQPRAPRPAPATHVDQAQTPVVAAVLPQKPVVTRPWPRAVLPQYAHDGLAVGFGDGTGAAPVHNPFRQPRLATVPAFEPVAADADAASPAVPGETAAAAESAPATDPR